MNARTWGKRQDRRRDRRAARQQLGHIDPDPRGRQNPFCCGLPDPKEYRREYGDANYRSTARHSPLRRVRQQKHRAPGFQQALAIMEQQDRAKQPDFYSEANWTGFFD